MTKRFRFYTPADRHATQILNGNNITKAQLQKVVCDLPIKKASVQYIDDQLHQNQLPHQDVGLALALVATNALMTEKAGKQLIEAGEELVIEELRTTMIESFVPMVERILEEGLPHLITAATAILGSFIGVIITHIPLLSMMQRLSVGLATMVSPNPTWLLTTTCYLIFLGALHLWRGRNREIA